MQAQSAVAACGKFEVGLQGGGSLAKKIIRASSSLLPRRAAMAQTKFAIAEHDFTAETDTELSFAQGDHILSLIHI